MGSSSLRFQRLETLVALPAWKPLLCLRENTKQLALGWTFSPCIKNGHFSKNKKVNVSPGQVAQFIRASSRHAKVADSVSTPGQGTYRNQPINASISGTISLSLSHQKILKNLRGYYVNIRIIHEFFRGREETLHILAAIVTIFMLSNSVFVFGVLLSRPRLCKT